MKKPLLFNKRLVLLGISLLLYIIGLSLPALAFDIVDNQTKQTSFISVMKGAEVTIWGILGLFFLQIPAIGCLANPLYWFSCKSFVQKNTNSPYFLLLLPLLSALQEQYQHIGWPYQMVVIPIVIFY
ncbi:hypothetical protein [Aulosira sp. FACHB-615]|uniref:hypothetical protein n=1 Tax=Aulosira sp. FACHB-615 TaxID=2692777 RepID=UPI001F54D9BF|nr:hypothetical protein [Aulosira sp. FACHB-615]